MGETNFESNMEGTEELLRRRAELQGEVEKIEERHQEKPELPSKEMGHLEAYDYSRRNNLLKEIAELDKRIGSRGKEQKAA